MSMEDLPLRSWNWTIINNMGDSIDQKLEDTFLELQLDRNQRTNLLEPIYSNSFGIHMKELAIVINLEELIAIIREEDVLFLKPIPKLFLEMLDPLKESLKQDNQGVFAHKILEKTLEHACKAFVTDLNALEKNSQDASTSITITDLRLMNRTVNRLLARVQTVRAAVCQLLGNNNIDCQMMLGDYCFQFDGILRRITEAKAVVDDTEYSINVRQESIRDKLAKTEMVVTIITLMLTLASVIIRVFGMNVTGLFWVVIWVLILGSMCRLEEEEAA